MAGAAIALATSMAAMSAGATELVTNGSFETGDFTGWAQFGDTDHTGVAAGCFDFGCPTDGSDLAYFGPVNGVGGISQTLATGAGLYDISFDLSNNGGAFFSADFGGANLLLNPPGEGVTHYSFTNVAASGPTTLSFSTLDVPAYYTLDNISVTAGVPEPASWALMIGGFFGLGATLRTARRRTAAAAA
ncbi:PEPxxWA-CTERM sorting domain-containing protein [Phenylobacterium sp.]|uniref:PEPxxWA-CTERM sorting domain-containing protein n=1 Tax=Phenylobacterium sp. TaxID=1871053 RepID=UPI00260C8138|nr:PEPxxWA-CTERM sorting domain-containing protein [Phenylobacterium sp.]